MSSDPRAALLEQALDALESGGADGLARFLDARPNDASWLRDQLSLLQRHGILVGAEDSGKVPDHLGEFQLKERVGRGGMGIVYRARQPSLQRDVALKVIRPERLFFEGARERFRREVESVARLEHPGIVRVYEAGDADGLPYFTMELVDGVSLEALLELLHARGEPPSDDRAVEGALRALRDARGSKAPLFEPTGASWIETCFRWTKELADALAYAHGLGVLHRDVKPANVMLTWSGRVMLLDFGLATTRGASRLTGTGALVGSVPYMAPEQLRGSRAEVDERADVYSLAVTLYELLSLRHPFHERGQESDETRFRIIEGTPLPLHRVASAVPWDAETVCLKAMDRDPERRYASASAFSEDLGNVLRFRPILARRPGPLLRLRRLTQRHPAWSVGAALGFVLIVGGPLGLWWAQVERTRALAGEQVLTKAALAVVTRQKDEIELKSEEVLVQERLAQQRFDIALDAVANVLTRIGFVELRNVPNSGEVRDQLLRLAESSAQKLLAELPDHARARFVACTVDQQRAKLLLDRGQHEPARRLAERAKATMDRFSESESVDPRHELLRGRIEGTLGNIHLVQDRWKESEGHYLTAVGLHRSAIDATDDVGLEDEHKRALAICLINWGTSLSMMLDHVEDGAAALSEACELLEEIGTNAEDSMLLGQALMNLGTMHVDRARHEEAEELFERAVQVFRELFTDDPVDYEIRRSLTHGLCSLGLAQGRLKRREEAIPTLEESLALARELRAGFPERVDCELELAFVLGNLGAQNFDREEFELAGTCLEEALTIYEKLDAGQDTRTEAFIERALTESHLSLALRRLGRDAEADDLRQRARRHIGEAGARFPDSLKRIAIVRSFIEGNE